MTDRNTDTSPLGSSTREQEATRIAREASIDAWYASPISHRGGLDTGARGWRFVVPAPRTPAR